MNPQLKTLKIVCKAISVKVKVIIDIIIDGIDKFV